MANISKIALPSGDSYNIKDDIKSGIYFVPGTQAASTNVWTGDLPAEVTEYFNGLTIAYQLPFAGTSSSATLNLGGLGAKPVYRGNSPTSGVTTHFPANGIIILTYIVKAGINSGNGAWISSAYYDSNNNDTVTGYTRYAHGTYTTTTAVGRYVICLSKTTTSVVPVTAVNNSTETSKVLTTDTFNPFGDIYYFTNNGSTTQTAANAALSAAYLWTAYSNINLGYSFNTGSTLTTNKDVFIKASPAANNMATLASTPIVQDLPNSDDGFIYIKLGHANSTSNIAMSYDHPIYYYKNGSVRIWTNPVADESKAAASNGTDLSLVTTGEKATWNAKTTNTGTVTKVTAGTGLSIGTTSGGNFTTTGTINHTNSVTAQTTQAVYPIKIDAQGHISAYGSAQTILSLGTGSGNAYRGDYGNTAYTHAVTNKGSAFSSGLYKITTNSEGHVIAATAVVKADITGLGIPAQDTTYTFDGTYNASTNKAATVSTVTNALIDTTLSGNTVAESVNSDEVIAGSLIVNGDARFVNTINGDISGNAATATKAVQDGSGNVITSTYVKKAGDTLSGALTTTLASGNSGEFTATRGDITIWLGIGSGNKNHGLYSSKKGDWMLYANENGAVYLNGNATTATKATQDGSGNTITSYYCTLSTAQTISGVKTFSAMPIATAGVRVSNTGNTEGCDFVYDDTTDSVLMSFH